MKIGNGIINKKVQAVVQTKYGIMPVSELDCFSGSTKRTLTTDEIIWNSETVNSIKDSISRVGKSGSLMARGVRWAPVVTRPQKIVCVGLNYKSHVSETNNKIPESPILFGKFTNSLAASGETIAIPKETRQLDYEGELGVVVGRKGRNISESKSMDYVFGYFVGNDLSARDLQFKTSQWFLGKTCNKFFPCGPFITTADEVKEPQKLSLKTRMNGRIRQSSDTSYMIFSIAFLVSYISKFMTLYPGDIISTGTPEGVIQGMPENSREWIRSGDKVAVEIESLGTLENDFT